MKTGLMKLLEDSSLLKSASVGVCCNHTAIDPKGDHVVPLLQQSGVAIKRVFGPEHGVDSTAQDMIPVDEEEVTKIETVSLYGETEDTLHPDPETLSDLDILVFDIQDIGSRYYTYQATLGYIMEVAKDTDTEIWVLDRPNPINGSDVSGNVVRAGYESFVSAYPLATRHGMTMGELGLFFQRELKIDCPLKVLTMEGWNRMSWYEDSGLPFVYPSPNMPTVDTAIIYVGMCLIEGTNISEGRGTTKPFHLFGAPWIDRKRLVYLLRKGAADSELKGVLFREATFEPRFQKHAGLVCHGAEIIITDRNTIEPLLLGLVVLEALLRENPEKFEWRTETYEYVDDPIAIDLLFGNSEGRGGLETKLPPREILGSWQEELISFNEKRERCLLYP
ncbi:MAG: DUF1343 domain-containing protein [Myxococcota bacterium]|nr:DUF1343 domain-containing protein [Myxococcota bacterium]